MIEALISKWWRMESPKVVLGNLFNGLSSFLMATVSKDKIRTAVVLIKFFYSFLISWKRSFSSVC